MDMYEKVLRVYEIGKELEVIKQTLSAIYILQGTVNMRTTERCLAITNKLTEKVDILWDEFQKLTKEIESFSEEDGL